MLSGRARTTTRKKGTSPDDRAGEGSSSGRVPPGERLRGRHRRADVQRWGAVPDDEARRRGPQTRPANALTKAEEDSVIALLKSSEFAELSPHQVVAKLAEVKIYKVPERTMYGLLHRRRLQRHRERN